MALIKREILTCSEVLRSKRKTLCEHNNRLNFCTAKAKGWLQDSLVTQLVNAILVFAC